MVSKRSPPHSRCFARTTFMSSSDHFTHVRFLTTGASSASSGSGGWWCRSRATNLLLRNINNWRNVCRLSLSLLFISFRLKHVLFFFSLFSH